jgi:hypothetical protein
MRTTDRQLRLASHASDTPTIEEMRWDIAEHEAINMQTKEVMDYLYYGFDGLEHKPDIEIRDEYNMLFGSE